MRPEDRGSTANSKWSDQPFLSYYNQLWPTYCMWAGLVTSSWDEASMYALWTRVSSETGRKYLSDSITVWLINDCTHVWWTWRWYLVVWWYHTIFWSFWCPLYFYDCGLIMAWCSALVCMLLYLFKRSQLGPKAASWISCLYMQFFYPLAAGAPLMYLRSGHLLLNAI
jgi:hypothetical protein